MKMIKVESMDEIETLPRNNKWNIPEPIETDDPSKLIEIGQLGGS